MIKSLQNYIKPFEDKKDYMLNVRVSYTLAQELNEIARSEGRKLSDIHRAALEKLVEESRESLLKKKEIIGHDLPREFPIGYQFPMFDRF